MPKKRSRGKRALALVLLALVVAPCLFYALARERVWFAWLQLNRKDPKVAREYAALLSERRAGVDLALADFSLLGGSTRGWSSWILRYSPLQDYIRGELKAIAEDRNTCLDKRLDALLMLWDKTKDLKYLEECFLAVCEPGPPLILFGRQALASASGLKEQLAAPPECRLSIDLAEFRRLLAQSGISAERRDGPDGTNTK